MPDASPQDESSPERNEGLDSVPGQHCELESATTSNPGERSDGELVELVRSGDRAAFASIVTRYQPTLHRVAFSRIGSVEAADEVVQEAFLCAFKFLDSYDSRQSFRTWLWTIALNQCHQRARRDQRSPRVSTWTDQQYEGNGTLEKGRELELVSREPNPLARLLSMECRELLELELRKLPETQADALRLRFFAGLKFEEISAAMRCSLGTAKNRVKWGLLKIAQNMAAIPSPQSESRHGENHEL